MQQPCRAGVQCMQQPCTWFCRVSLHLAGVRLTRQPCQLTNEPCFGGIGISGFGRIGGEGHNVIDGSGSRGCSVLQGRNAIFPCQWSWRANCDRGSGVSTFKDGADVGVGGGLARRGGSHLPDLVWRSRFVFWAVVATFETAAFPPTSPVGSTGGTGGRGMGGGSVGGHGGGAEAGAS